MSIQEEMLGADYCEHGILPRGISDLEAIQALERKNIKEIVASNKVHNGPEVVTNEVENSKHVNEGYQNETEADEGEQQNAHTPQYDKLHEETWNGNRSDKNSSEKTNGYHT